MRELHERAAGSNFRLWDGLPDGLISIDSCVKAGSAERNWLTNRARKNFGTGPYRIGRASPATRRPPRRPSGSAGGAACHGGGAYWAPRNPPVSSAGGTIQ